MLCGLKGSYAMSGRRTGASTVAWLQAQLVRPVTYDWSVSDQARDLLKWFPFSTPDPLFGSATPDTGLGAVGSFEGGCL